MPIGVFVLLCFGMLLKVIGLIATISGFLGSFEKYKMGFYILLGIILTLTGSVLVGISHGITESNRSSVCDHRIANNGTVLIIRSSGKVTYQGNPVPCGGH